MSAGFRFSPFFGTATCASFKLPAKYMNISVFVVNDHGLNVLLKALLAASCCLFPICWLLVPFVLWVFCFDPLGFDATYLDGQSLVPVPMSVLLYRGSYTLQLSAPGCAPARVLLLCICGYADFLPSSLPGCLPSDPVVVLSLSLPGSSRSAGSLSFPFIHLFFFNLVLASFTDTSSIVLAV